MSEITPLAELLRALAPPLEYLAADDFRRVQQTHLPLPALAERVARARTAASPAAAATLVELERILAELASGPPREELFRRAHALLPLLRDAAAVPWSDYRPVAEPVAAALETLARPVEAIRGVGPQRAAQLSRFGLRTVEDALYHLPFRYEDRRALRPLASLHVGEEATAAGEVAHVRESRGGRRRRAVLEVVLRDADGLLLLVWFHRLSYFQRRFAEGQRVVVHGRVEPPLGGGPPRLIHPEVEVLGTGEEVAPQIVPVYEKPTEMHVGAMRRIVQAAVTDFAERVPSALPPAVAARQRVIELPRALRHVHAPRPEAALEELAAARSLATAPSSSTSSSSSSSGWRSGGRRRERSRARPSRPRPPWCRRSAPSSRSR